MPQEDIRRDGVPSNGFSLQHDSAGRLVLQADDGRQHVGVDPVRLFPLSEPDRWISLCDADGHELQCVEDLAELPLATRRIIEEELQHRDFLPIIHRIERVSAHEDPSHWQVETDRGPTAFYVNSEDDVHRLGNYGAVIIDSNSIRYLIPDTRRVDATTRRVLDRYI